MERLNIVDGMSMARSAAPALINKAVREDDGPLFNLASQLLHGKPAEVEMSCHQLVSQYDNGTAKNILLGFEI